MLTYIQLDIYIRIFPTRGACQRIKWKGERWRSPWLLHKVKDIIIKDRPFAEGSRGCHALLWLDAQNLNAKEHHFILPLVMWTFIMQSVAFIASITRSYKVYFLHTNKSCIFREHILFLAPMTTYLKDLTQSIGRYGWLSWQNWVLGMFGSTSSISTWCKEFG